MLKQAARRCLTASGYHVVRLPPRAVSGSDLPHDLATVVGRSDPLCLDVGANNGQTIRLLQRAFANPVIHAFEPAPETFARLQAQNLPGRVTLHDYALGARADEREFSTYADTDLSSFLALDQPEANGFRGAQVTRRDRVPIRTVDGFVEAQRLTTVDLLKIDAQGFDLEVLMGARQSLQAGVVRCVLAELNFVPVYQGQSGAAEILAFLKGVGFQLVDYYEKCRRGNALAWCTAMFCRDQ